MPIGSGDYGTAHPMLIRAFDKHERWIALCQARNDTDGDGKIQVFTGRHGAVYGDAMQLFLVLGGGSGTPIDALVSPSADERWLVVLLKGGLWLVDTESGALFALRDADIESDGRPGAPHRAAMFANNRLLYVRHRTTGDSLVIHEPVTHTEREIAVRDRIWRIEGGGDRLAGIVTIPQGERWPFLRTSLDAGECLGPPMSYSVGGQSGPKPTSHWLELDEGTEVVADGAVAAVGSTLVRTPSDGALYLDADQIGPPACKPQILAVLSSPVRVIAICGARKAARVRLLGRGLDVELAAIDRDKNHYDGLEDALVPATGVVCDAGLHCVTTATNRSVDLEGGVATYAFGDKLYVVHATTSSRRYEIIDVVAGSKTPTEGGDARMAVGKVIIDDDENVIDLDTGKIVAKATGALRVANSGRILRSTGEDKSKGPLRWSTP